MKFKETRGAAFEKTFGDFKPAENSEQNDKSPDKDENETVNRDRFFSYEKQESDEEEKQGSTDEESLKSEEAEKQKSINEERCENAEAEKQENGETRERETEKQESITGETRESLEAEKKNNEAFCGTENRDNAAAYTQEAKGDKHDIKVSVEKIVRAEKDNAPKYQNATDAVNSIFSDGAYYEDFLRGGNAGLFKSKDFVLAAISQNHERFYAPETPKPYEWLDEEYLCARISYFFDETKESIKQEAAAELSENLYNYLLKAAFSADAYGVVINSAKLAAKANAAKVKSVEDGERMKESLVRFNSAFNTALNLAKEKYLASVKYEEEKAQRLSEGKNALNNMIENMKFDI